MRRTKLIRRRDGVVQKYHVSDTEKKHIIKDYNLELAKELKKESKVRIPELGILKLKHVKARPARPGINPFTKEKVTFKAKPAYKKIKFSPLKSLKEMI